MPGLGCARWALRTDAQISYSSLPKDAAAVGAHPVRSTGPFRLLLLAGLPSTYVRASLGSFRLRRQKTSPYRKWMAPRPGTRIGGSSGRAGGSIGQKGGYLQTLPSVLLWFIPRALRTKNLASLQRGCGDATKKREIQTREGAERESRTAV